MNSWSINFTGTPKQIAEAAVGKRYDHPETQAAYERALPLISALAGGLDEKKKFNLTASGSEAGAGMIMTVNIQPR